MTLLYFSGHVRRYEVSLWSIRRWSAAAGELGAKARSTAIIREMNSRKFDVTREKIEIELRELRGKISGEILDKKRNSRSTSSIST